MGFTRRPHEKDTRNSRWGYDAAVDFQWAFGGLSVDFLWCQGWAKPDWKTG